MAHLLLSSDTHDESHFKPLNYAQIHRATKNKNKKIKNIYISWVQIPKKTSI